jgi:flagellar motor switch protein FliN/FliY
MADNEDNEVQDNGAEDAMAEDQNTEAQNVVGGEEFEEAETPQTDVAELLSEETPPEPHRSARDLDAVYDVPVQLSAVLGRSTMQVNQLLKLGRGAIVELDRKVGEAIDIYVNNRLVARGEVVVVEERLGVTMTEIIKSDRTNSSS